MLTYKKEVIDISKDWIILVHGFGLGDAVWKNQRKILKNNYNLLFINLPGHGNNYHNLRDIKNPSFYKMSLSLNDILKENNIEEATFIGLSLGSIFIEIFETYFPKKVKVSILYSPIENLDRVTKYILWLAFIFRLLTPYKLMYKFLIGIFLPFNKRKETRQNIIKNYRTISRFDFYKWYTLRKEVYVYFNNFKEVNPNKKYYIFGDRDFLFIKKLKEKLKNKTEIKNEKIIKIKNSNHLCNLHQPEKVNQLTIKILEKNA